MHAHGPPPCHGLTRAGAAGGILLRLSLEIQKSIDRPYLEESDIRKVPRGLNSVCTNTALLNQSHAQHCT
jgi:hypothetical protein